MKTLICVYIAIDYQPRFIHTFVEQVEFIADIFPLKKGPYQFYKPHYFIFHLLQIFVQDTKDSNFITTNCCELTKINAFASISLK